MLFQQPSTMLKQRWSHDEMLAAYNYEKVTSSDDEMLAAYNHEKVNS